MAIKKSHFGTVKVYDSAISGFRWPLDGPGRVQNGANLLASIVKWTHQLFHSKSQHAGKLIWRYYIWTKSNFQCWATIENPWFLHIVLLYKLEVRSRLFVLFGFRRGLDFSLGETQCQSVGVE